jgi:hypothetical protein
MVSSLLMLSACNTQTPAEQASEQAAGEMNMKAGSLYEETPTKPAATAESPETVGHAMGEVPPEQPAR